MSRRSSPRRSPVSTPKTATVVFHINSLGKRAQAFTIPETEPMESFLRDYCAKSELLWGSTTFTDRDGRTVDVSATPKALGYTGRVNLMATPVVAETVISPAITGASPSPKSRKLVTLKVTSPSGEVATKRVAVDAPFKVAFEQLIAKWDLVGKPIKFFLNGKKLVSPDSTPSTHNIAGTAELVARERADPAPKKKAEPKKKAAEPKSSSKSDKTSIPEVVLQPANADEEEEHRSFWSRCEVC